MAKKKVDEEDEEIDEEDDKEENENTMRAREKDRVRRGDDDSQERIGGRAG